MACVISRVVMVKRSTACAASVTSTLILSGIDDGDVHHGVRDVAPATANGTLAWH